MLLPYRDFPSHCWNFEPSGNPVDEVEGVGLDEISVVNDAEAFEL